MTKHFAGKAILGLTIAAAAALLLACPHFSYSADNAPPVAQPAKPQAAKPAAKPQATQPAKPQATQPAKPQQAAQGQKQGQVQANKVTQTAMKAGVQKCAQRVNQVANFLTQQSPNFGAVMFMPPSNPNSQLFSSSIEVNNPNLPPAYASASFAPTEAGCGGMYETVIYWQNGCNDVFKTQFAGMKQIGTLSKGIPILGGNGNARVFLMAAGTGCVSIKKEVVW